MSRRVSRSAVLWGLRACTLAGGIGAVAAAAWPVDAPPAPMAVRPATDDAASDRPAPDADAVIRTNLFSPTRRAPAAREQLATLDTFPEPTVAGDGAGMTGSDVAAGFDAQPVPQLLGIVDGPGGARALLRLDADKARAALFGVGDGTNGWRVVAIGGTSVTLDGPSGRQVVSLQARSGTP